MLVETEQQQQQVEEEEEFTFLNSDLSHFLDT